MQLMQHHFDRLHAPQVRKFPKLSKSRGMYLKIIIKLREVPLYKIAAQSYFQT